MVSLVSATRDRILTQLGRYAALTSQTINCLLLFGHHDQTISARCWINRNRLPWRVMHRLIDGLFRRLPIVGHENHCYSSHMSDVQYAREVLDESKDKNV